MVGSNILFIQQYLHITNLSSQNNSTGRLIDTGTGERTEQIARTGAVRETALAALGRSQAPE